MAGADKVSINGNEVSKNSLKAEATDNTVLKDGVITVGSNPAQSANNMTQSVQDTGAEPGLTVTVVNPIFTVNPYRSLQSNLSY